jgi:hypothetical protein
MLTEEPNQVPEGWNALPLDNLEANLDLLALLGCSCSSQCVKNNLKL